MRHINKFKEINILLLILLSLFIIPAYSINYNNKQIFDNGSYNNTFYDSSRFIQLKNNNSSGDYISDIVDAGNSAIWNLISWNQEICYKCALLDYGSSEKAYTNNLNMTGNVFLAHLDETNVNHGTKIKDTSNNPVDGVMFTYEGSTNKNSKGIFNDSIKFDGMNDFVNYLQQDTSKLRIVGDISISVWVNISSSTNNADIVVYGSDGETEDTNVLYSIRTTTANGNDISYIHETDEGYNNLNVFDTNLKINEWYNIVIVRNINTKTVKLYVNGMQVVGSYKYDYNPSGGSSGKFSIGSGREVLGSYFYNFNGLIDELSIWNSTLTESEIYNLYGRGIMNLELSVRSCNDPYCNGENFISLITQSPQQLLIADNRYFQYKYDFTTSNVLFSPKLSNVTIDYSSDIIYPNINSIYLTPQLTSGEIALLKANVTDNIEVSSVWASVIGPEGIITNYTLNKELSSDFYDSYFYAGKTGMWKIKLYANDTSNKVTDTSEWIYFYVTKPAANIKSISFPRYSLPSSSIIIKSDFEAGDLLFNLNATLNSDTSLLFPYFEYSKLTSNKNLSSGQITHFTWLFYLPNDLQNNTFNITFNDQYGNVYSSSNFDIKTTYDTSLLSDNVNNNTLEIINLLKNLTSINQALNLVSVKMSYFAEVEAGGIFESEIQTRNLNGNLIDPESLKITLIDPNGNIVISKVDYTSKLSLGSYNYKYILPSAPTGYWKIIANISNNGKYYSEMNYFKVTGGPFDIRNINIEDNELPSLEISSILENKGHGVTDIIIDWNLTKADTGEILDHGRDTIGVNGGTTKVYTVYPITSYSGLVSIDYLGYWSNTEKASAKKTFSIKKPNSENPKTIENKIGGSSSAQNAISSNTNKEITGNLIKENFGNSIKSNIEIQNLFSSIKLSPNVETRKDIIIKNNGQTILYDVKLNLEGLPLMFYSITPTQADILPGSSQNFNIIFTPDVQGVYPIKFILFADNQIKEYTSTLIITNNKFTGFGIFNISNLIDFNIFSALWQVILYSLITVLFLYLFVLKSNTNKNYIHKPRVYKYTKEKLIKIAIFLIIGFVSLIVLLTLFIVFLKSIDSITNAFYLTWGILIVIMGILIHITIKLNRISQKLN